MHKHNIEQHNSVFYKAGSGSKEMVYIGSQGSILKFSEENNALNLGGKDYRVERNQAFIAGVIDSSRPVTLLERIDKYSGQYLTGVLLELCWLSDNGYKFSMEEGKIVGRRLASAKIAKLDYANQLYETIEQPSGLFNKCSNIIREIQSLNISENESEGNTSLDKHEKKSEISTKKLIDADGFETVKNNKKSRKFKPSIPDAQREATPIIASQFTQFVTSQTSLSNPPSDNPSPAQSTPKAQFKGTGKKG
jgi:hypothetical protein